LGDTYRKRDFKRKEYPGGFSTREEDHDLLAHHNQEMIERGIDPNTGKVFNPYLAKTWADQGDPEARKAYQEWKYEQMSDSIHPKLSTLIGLSFNTYMAHRRKFATGNFRTAM
jgi:hypothetical protein